MIGAEQSTEAFAPYHTTRLTTHCSLRRDKPVVEALVIAFCMIVGQVLVDRMMQGAFPQHDHPFQGLFLDRAYEPFAMGIEIRTPRGQENRFHPTGLEQRIKRLGEFSVPVMDQIPFA